MGGGEQPGPGVCGALPVGRPGPGLWSSSLHCTERDVLVDPGFGGEAEHPFADDVALDLVAAAGDAVARGAEDVLAPGVGAPLAGIGGETGPKTSVATSVMRRMCSVQASLPIEPSGPGVWPPRVAAATRSALSRNSVAPM